MKKFLIHLLITSVLLLPVLFTNNVAYANGSTPPPKSPGGSSQVIRITNPLKQSVGNNLPDLLVAILNNVVMPIAAVASVMYIILAGFKYVTARGNSAKIQSAHENLLWALVGAGILLGAAGISKVLQSTVSQFIEIN
ncbi:MAG: hypothetical protein WC095_02130 [Candidatus Paceibacterota bacterium]